MTESNPSDISNRLFVRFYRRGRKAATRRGEDEHRRRLLAGLSGRVVELGAGDGANFGLYPAEVEEVIAVETEPRFRAEATKVAAHAPVPIRVLRGTAQSLPVEDASMDAVVAS